MSLEDFEEAFKKFSVLYLNKDWKNSFIEKRNAINKRIYRFNFTITEHDLPILIQKDINRGETCAIRLIPEFCSITGNILSIKLE